MLTAMYAAWAERRRLPLEILDVSHGDRDGIRASTISIGGDRPGTLEREQGLHRLVRISPFDRARRRQTSLASIEVVPAPPERVLAEIRKADVAMDAFRAGGPGGQHVNKVATAVRLTHIPTGITAVCRTERSQAQNRQNAMRLLAARINDRERREPRLRRDDPPGPGREQRVRSYCLHPRQLVTDHRTGAQTRRAQDVLQGWLEPFLDG